jgi:ribosome biogenesis ATPase
MGIPTEAARAKMLKVLTRPLRLQGDFDHAAIARRTPGFVGADLAALAKEAAAAAVTRIFSRLDGHQQQEADAAAAAAVEQAAAVVEGEGQQQQQEGQQEQQEGQQQQLQLQVVPAAAPRLDGGVLTAAELTGLAITMADFEVALPKVQPSVRREGFTTKPGVTWDDVGSLEEVRGWAGRVRRPAGGGSGHSAAAVLDFQLSSPHSPQNQTQSNPPLNPRNQSTDQIREELSFAISQPIAHPERFAAMGLAAATGVLLYGPPGCGKTLVAKAVANESGANFISIKVGGFGAQ